MNDVLKWFKDIIINRNWNILHTKYKDLAMQSNGYFMPNHPYDGTNNEYIYFVDMEMNNELISKGYSYETFIQNEVSAKYNDSVYNIDNNSSIIDKTELEVYFKDLLSKVSTLIVLSEEIDYFNLSSELSKSLLKLQQHLTDKINNKNALEFNSTNTFQFQGKVTDIKKLYNLLEELNFFNYYNNQYNKFKEVILNHNNTYTMFENLQDCLKIECSTEKAAYILFQIRPLFNNFSFRQIQNSKAFITKQGHPLTESNLSKSKNLFIEKSDNFIDDKDFIDEKIETLLSEIKG